MNTICVVRFLDKLAVAIYSDAQLVVLQLRLAKIPIALIHQTPPEK